MLDIFSGLRHDQVKFVQKTYLVLSGALAIMTVLGVFSYFFLSPVAALPVLILDSIIWIACGWFGLRNPIKAVFPVFLIITGLALGQIAHFYRPDVFLAAGITTLMIFAGTSAYVFFTKQDFSFLRVALNIGFWILLAAAILGFFLNLSAFSLIIGIFGSLIFIGWILYDTSKILLRADELNYNENLGAFDLFMDIIGLFSFVRSLFKILD
jgi:FtsH-binding integral membrane protein